MAEVDPVILDLIARDGAYRARLIETTNIADKSFNRQQRGVERLEKQMLKSSTAIGNSFRTLAGSLATYFTGRELTGLIDSFTRLQNNLKVAGLEGQNLAKVQQSLLDISSRYGTSVEGLSGVFLKASLAQKELGASTSDIIRLNEIIAASLKVTGTSAQEAQGALLQLGQALGSGVVRAEEFNSILEGALPLAQAAARGIDGFGGSVAKLRAAVANGQITSQQFFEGVLKGGVQTLQDAEKATLTLSGAFETLRSRLTVYVGESAKANGVTAALAGGLNLLAENLDTVIKALATIVAIIGVQYVAAAARATAANVALAASATGSASAMGVLGAASFAMQARMIGAATSMEAAAFAARGLGGSLLSLAGGPYGALIALGAGLAYVIATTDDAATAAAQYRKQQEALKDIQEKSTEVTERLAAATGKARAEALANAKALREETKQYLANAQAALIAAEAKAVQARETAKQANQSAQADFGELGRGRISPNRQKANAARRELIQADADAKAAEENVINARKEIARLTGIINAAAPPAVTPAGSGSGKKSGKGSGPSGPSAAEIEARFNDELINYAQQALSARQSMATSAQERAELELRGVELARRQALDGIAADKDYTEAQKQRAADAVENLAEIERERILRDQRIQEFEEANDLADQRNRAEQDALRNQYDLATTDEDRRRIALQILDAEDAYLRSKLEAVTANQDLTDAVRAQAQAELDALNSSAADRRALVQKANQGALGRYIDDITDTKARVEEATVRQLQAVNDGITDALTSQLGIKNQFVKDLFSIFLDEAIFKPLAESLREGSSGSSPVAAFFSSIFGSIFGRASGGYAAPGSIHRVNESAGGVELLRMGSQGGEVIPLGRVNASAARGGGQTVIQQTINVDARGVNPQGFAEHIKSEVRKETVSIVAQASNATLKAVPGKIASYNQDGTL